MNEFMAIVNTNGGMHNDIDLCYIVDWKYPTTEEFVENMFLIYVGNEGFESVEEWFEYNRKDKEVPENLLEWWEEEILGGEDFPYIMTIYKNGRLVYQHGNFNNL